MRITDLFAHLAPGKIIASAAAALAVAVISMPAAAYVVFPAVQKSSVRVVNVSTAAGLLAALKDAKGPTEILLAPGNYGSVRIVNINHPFDIVIRSANHVNRAEFNQMRVRNSSRIRLERLNFQLRLQPGQAENSSAVMVRDSQDISVSRSNFPGNMNGTPNDDGIAFRALNASRILLFNNYFSEARVAIGLTSVTHSSVFANRIYNVREGVNLNSVETVRLERNYVSHVIPNKAAGDHADAFQIFYGTNADARASRDVLFQSNAMILDRGNAQALHVRNSRTSEQHQDIRALHNVIFAGVRQGLWIEDTTGAVLDRNTIITAPGWLLEPAIFLRNAHNTTIRRNIYPMLLTGANVSGVTASANIDLADSFDPKGPAANMLLAGNTNIFDPQLSSFSTRPEARMSSMVFGASLSPGVGGFTGSDASIEQQFQMVLSQVRGL